MNMKLLVLTVFVFSLLVGCQPGNVEVLKEKKSDKTEMWEILISKSVFSLPDSKKCDAVNRKVSALVDSLVGDFKMRAMEYNKAFDTIPNGEPMRPLEMFVEDSVFMANDNYISSRLKVYILLGGANGETMYYAVNYDLNHGRFLSKGEILNLEQESEINGLLKKEFKNPDHCFTDEPTVATCSALNFTGTNLCFTYGKYVLGAGACGNVEVNVDRSILNKLLLIK